MSEEWYLPTGRTADEFMAEMKGNLRHDAGHLFGRIWQADLRIAELARLLQEGQTLMQEHADRIKELEAAKELQYEIMELKNQEIDKLQARLDAVADLADELRNTFTALPDLTKANPTKVDRYVRDLIADELEATLEQGDE
jgi:predicted nuclease with TOPRIM domain